MNIMKKLFLLLLIFISLQVDAQSVKTKNPGTWYISVGSGASVFLGDISPQPKFTLKKNMNDYEYGDMFRLGKQIIPALDINLEILKGKISGHKKFDANMDLMDQAFRGDYWGITFNARINLKIYKRTRATKCSLYGRIGAGPLYYRAVMRRLSTGDFLESAGFSDYGNVKGKRRQCIIVPAGLGLTWMFSDNLHFETGVDLYSASTDFLDAHHGIASDRNDAFLIASCSLIYIFDWDDWQAPRFRY
jgi:hypothetical protein